MRILQQQLGGWVMVQDTGGHPVGKARYLIGLLSLVLSVALWVLISKILFPMMDFRSQIPFTTFELISLPLSVVPLVLGAIALCRREHKLVAITGTVVSSVTVLWLLFLMLTSGGMWIKSPRTQSAWWSDDCLKRIRPLANRQVCKKSELSIRSPVEVWELTKQIVCQRCGQCVKTQHELVTILSLFKGVMPYHLDCYAANQKGWNAARPINSQGTIAVIIVGLIVCSIAFVSTKVWIFILAGLFAPLLRFWSWFFYERFLPL